MSALGSISSLHPVFFVYILDREAGREKKRAFTRWPVSETKLVTKYFDSFIRNKSAENPSKLCHSFSFCGFETVGSVSEMNDLKLCLEVAVRSCQPLCYIRHLISRKPLETEAWFPTNREWPMGYEIVT